MGGLTPALALQLGRVSNLPTVWSNVLAGMVLAGVFAPSAVTLVTVIAACTLMYVGGMFLNDAFDAEIDARERPDRPIPSGQISKNAVLAWGLGMLAVGILLALTHGLATGTAALLLAGSILLYDWHHKNNPLSPVIMGVCRMLVYAVAALAVSGTLPGLVIGGALALLAYLIGLTYVAKQENLHEIKNMWPLAFLAAPFIYALVQVSTLFSLLVVIAFAIWTMFALSYLRRKPRQIPKTVVSLIAGISLLDATLVALTGAIIPVILAVICFGATLFGQRYVSGT